MSVPASAGAVAAAGMNAPRTIDPTRQGAHEPDAADTNCQDAPPVTLAEAIAAVDAWKTAPGMPLTRLHRIAQVLAVARAGASAYCDGLLDLLGKARDENARLKAELADLQRNRRRKSRPR